MVTRSGKNGYFSDEKADCNIEKKNFPENALCYMNQSYFSTVKDRGLAIYCQNFILGQLLVAANQPENIDEYVCKKNEVKFAFIIIRLVIFKAYNYV